MVNTLFASLFYEKEKIMNAKDAKKIVKSAHKDAYKSTVIQTGENETVSVKVNYMLTPALETLAISEIADMMFIPLFNDDGTVEKEVYNEEIAKSVVAVKFFTEIAAASKDITTLDMREIDVAYGISDKINTASKGYLDRLVKDARVLSRERRVKPIRDRAYNELMSLNGIVGEIMNAASAMLSEEGEDNG